MHQNPYIPPKSSSEESFAIAPSAKRPVSVWLLLILLTAIGVVFAAGAGRLSWLAITRAIEVRDALLFSGALAWRLALALGSILLATFIYKRNRHSRWLGVVVIACLAIWNLLRPDDTQYNSEAEEAGGFLGKLFLVPALFIWWSYAFAFSQKARRYFSGSNRDA
jgi:lysylphosphatidylglycerol synthetase-like protein (DUF2156 family)